MMADTDLSCATGVQAPFWVNLFLSLCCISSRPSGRHQHDTRQHDTAQFFCHCVAATRQVGNRTT